MSKNQTDIDVEEYVKEIPHDTILIEVRGGCISHVHNDPNGYVLFDWDYIEEEDTIEFHKKVLKKLRRDKWIEIT